MLMKLAPESVRLRRMAKAHAAGEMSEQEYRAARRQVIDHFPTVPVTDDDTQRRFADEPTVRGAAAESPSLEVQQAVGPEEVLAASRRRWPWLVFLVLMLTGLVLALPKAMAGPAGTDVPPVAQRSADPASSPRLTVGAVRVAWGGDGSGLPEALLESLQQAAALKLDEIRARNAPGPHGFTASELNEVARFLNVLGVHDGAAELDAADARDLSALIREQKSRRGISVAQLEEVAGAVQSELRAQGYFLAVAYLPAQQVAGGVARIDALPGRLGDIVVEGGDPGPVTGAFSPLTNQPLTLAAVSSRLQALNALPGVTAQASFVPGARVGESRLRLDLLEQRDWVGSVRVDNHGEEETGEQRLAGSISWLNPRRVGDRLIAGALASFNPANQTYGYVDYDTPLAPGYRLSARLGNNDFTREGVTDLDGSGVFFDLAARRSLTYSRTRGLTLVLTAGRQSLDWDDGVEQTVTLGGVGLAGHRVLDAPRLAADAAVSLSVGHIGGDLFAGQDDGFWMLEVDSQAWMPVSLPLLDGEQKLSVTLAGQWADSLLPATRRFALGGAGRARGYDRSVYLGDRGVLLGLEARVPIPLGELVVFSDLGYGGGRADDDHDWARLVDVGLGWDARLTDSLVSRVSWALPLATEGTGGLDDDGARLYWSLSYDL